jgi:hypothetical protein
VTPWPKIYIQNKHIESRGIGNCIGESMATLLKPYQHRIPEQPTRNADKGAVGSIGQFLAKPGVPLSPLETATEIPLRPNFISSVSVALMYIA